MDKVVYEIFKKNQGILKFGLTDFDCPGKHVKYYFVNSLHVSGDSATQGTLTYLPLHKCFLRPVEIQDYFVLVWPQYFANPAFPKRKSGHNILMPQLLKFLRNKCPISNMLYFTVLHQ